MKNIKRTQRRKEKTTQISFNTVFAVICAKILNIFDLHVV